MFEYFKIYPRDKGQIKFESLLKLNLWANSKNLVEDKNGNTF